MAGVDRDIEALIVRSLDETLSEDEELRLNRELMRNREARQMLEQYRRIDELAGVALHDALDRDGLPLDPELLPERTERPPMPRHRAGWWLVPGAVAAALLALMVARYPITPVQEQTTADRGYAGPEALPRIAGPLAGSPEHVQPNDGVMRNAGLRQPVPRVRREMGRDVIGVIGENGNIYWIEVDRTQTIRWPSSGPSARSTPGEM
jgi:hypothetical protein